MKINSTYYLLPNQNKENKENNKNNINIKKESNRYFNNNDSNYKLFNNKVEMPYKKLQNIENKVIKYFISSHPEENNQKTYKYTNDNPKKKLRNLIHLESPNLIK